ncbi:MAG: RsmB/NOP family class I SAM-dependent RNA methyltransferase [Rhodospirillales bacterium]|nr:RsmB/NOP family class I SAM-dependent RNA methyltransferase [Rhodospirillales bacterium]
MTPSARVQGAIDLLAAVATWEKPADAVANSWFRDRRFIGSGDRREISARVWAIIRDWRKLTWRLRSDDARLLVAAAMLLEGANLARLEALYNGTAHSPRPLEDAERAVLRPLEGASRLHPRMPDDVRLEVPAWLLPRLHERFGADTEAELAALLAEAPLDLRVNLLKSDRETARAALAAEGIEARPTPFSPWGLRVAGRRPVVTGKAFRDGLIEIQDEGSQIVALLAGARPGMRVLDYCAGAGGKTLALAMTMANKGHVVAADVSAPRLEGAVRRLRRAGVHNVERHLMEAGDKWAKRRAGSFDRVLVDAPCTGTGTWRRNPDARLRLAESDLLELLAKQQAILAAAAKLLRPGGRLVYAVCSVLEEEGAGQVERFLAGETGMRLVPAREAWPDAPTSPYLATTPRQHGTDGFFAAVVERAT